MGMKIHERDLRGGGKQGWLDTKHTFSFGHFHDPDRMGFRSLRVINEDRIIGGAGFPTHPHDNMEIITIVLSGELAHKDSMGNGSAIRPGEVQKMGAGTGITHSEFNASKTESCHLYQIWIIPDERGIAPGYEQITVNDNEARKGFTKIGDRQGDENTVSIHQDAQLYIAKPEEGSKLSHHFEKGRHGFLQIMRGIIELDGEVLKEGDGLQLSDIETLSFTAKSDAELLLFDLA